MLNRYTGDRDLIPHSSGHAPTTWPEPSTTGMIPVKRRPDDWVMVTPPEGSAIRCSHCNSVAACVSGDNLIVVQRHHGQYHKTVFPVTSLFPTEILVKELKNRGA